MLKQLITIKETNAMKNSDIVAEVSLQQLT